MGKIDIAIIIIVLLFLILGFVKGFMKQILSVGNWLLALIGSFLLVKPISGLIAKTNISTKINGKVSDWIATKGVGFNELIDYGRAEEQLADAITELGLPKFISSAIAGGFKLTGAEGELTLAEVLSPTIGSIILTIFTFIILFIVLVIIIKLLFKLLNKVFDDGLLGIVNKILGGALGLIKAAVVVSVLMLILSSISGLIPSLNEFLIADLKLGTDTFSIGKFLYEKNPLLAILKGTFDFKDLLAELTESFI